jgi:hypothetical protein
VSTPGEHNPYASPQHAGTPGGDEPELKKTPVLVVILLTIVSLGIYIPIWFLRRRKALNHLAPEDDTVDLVTFGLAAVWAFAFGFGVYSGITEQSGQVSTGLWHELATRWLDVISRVLTIVAAFRVKTILEGHYPERLSAVGTFFLSIVYLQYRINRAGQTDPVAENFTLR